MTELSPSVKLPRKINAIFIMGHARSGTSLVNNIIKAHPRVLGGSETRLFRHFHDMYKFSEKQNKQTGIYSFHKDTLFLYDLVKEFVTNYYITYARSNHKSFFVEKTPSQELSLPLIKHCFPDAKIIYCLRDGRDVWLSHKELARHDDFWRKSKPKLNVVAETWSQSVNICFSQKDFDSSQFYIIKYEHLTHEPYNHIEKMFCFCNLSYNEIPMKTLSNNVEYNHNLRCHKNYQLGFRGKWKTYMSTPEKKKFKDLAGEALLNAGYEKDLNWT